MNPPEISELRWQDLSAGMRHAFETLITAEILDRYAQCSGDFSPIHMSAEAARARGHPGRVAHGMLLGGLLSRLVGCHLPGRWALLLSANLKFHRPCIEGETVRVEGTIADLSPATRTISLSVKFTVNGDPRATATALVALKEPS